MELKKDDLAALTLEATLLVLQAIDATMLTVSRNLGLPIFSSGRRVRQARYCGEAGTLCNLREPHGQLPRVEQRYWRCSCDNMTVVVIGLLRGKTKDEWYKQIADRVANGDGPCAPPEYGK